MNSSTTISINFKDKEGIFFEVPSSTDEKITYNVHCFYKTKETEEDDWICTCPGWHYRHNCKHIQACQNILSEAIE